MRRLERWKEKATDLLAQVIVFGGVGIAFLVLTVGPFAIGAFVVYKLVELLLHQLHVIS